MSSICALGLQFCKWFVEPTSFLLQSGRNIDKTHYTVIRVRSYTYRWRSFFHPWLVVNSSSDFFLYISRIGIFSQWYKQMRIELNMNTPLSFPRFLWGFVAPTERALLMHTYCLYDMEQRRMKRDMYTPLKHMHRKNVDW